MHESQESLSYKQTPKSSKISKFQTISNNFKQFQTISNNFKQFQTISNNFTKTIKNRLNFVGFCLGILMEDDVFRVKFFLLWKDSI